MKSDEEALLGGNSKDIMHVRAVVGSGAEPGDVELAQLLLLWQLDVVAEVAVIALVEGRRAHG